MSKSADAFRTISEVADWLGVQSHVLRFWESKFPQVKPVKRAGGRRYYRPADMLLLGGIRKLLHEDGLTIKGVQKILREEGTAHVSDMSLPLDDDTSAQLDGDLVTSTPTSAEIAPAATPMPAPPAASASGHEDNVSLESETDDADEQDNDDVPDGIDHSPTMTLTEDGPFSDEDEDEAEQLDATPAPSTPAVVPPFMRDPEMDAAALSKEDRSEDVPILTSDFTPDPVTPPVSDDATPEEQTPTESAEQTSLKFENSSGPFGEVEQDAATTSQLAQVDAPESLVAQPADSISEPAPEPTAEASPEPAPEPIAELAPEPTPIPDPASAFDPITEADAAPTDETEAAPKPIFQHFNTAPEAPVADPEPVLDTASGGPEQTASDPIVDAPASEPVDEPAPIVILRPRIVDVPDDDQIDETGIAPSALSKSMQLSRLSAPQGGAIRPLVAQLTALRDQMANARRDPN